MFRKMLLTMLGFFVLSITPVDAEVCDVYEFGTVSDMTLQLYIYPAGKSWDFTATKSLSVQTISVKSILASFGGTFHIQIKQNNSLIATWDQYVNDTTFKAYSHSANVSVDLKAGDTITYRIYGETKSSEPSAGVIVLGGSIGVNQIQLCGTDPQIGSGCIPVGNDLVINMPCAEYNAHKYAFTLNPYVNADDPFGLYWMMDIPTFTEIQSYTGNCLNVKSDLALNICAKYGGMNYGFTMDFYQMPQHSDALYWKMNLSTFKAQ